MGGICTPLRLVQHVQVGCWLLLAQSSNDPTTRNTWGQSHVITRQTCAPANTTFLQCTLQTWDAEQQLCQFFVYRRLQTTPSNMLHLHKQILAFILLSQL